MLTLTYDPEHLPEGMTLVHRDFQLFMKRFREQISPLRVGFFMCGEYGEENSRPHYHVCIFGFDAPDRKYHRTSKAGFKCYTSEFFKKLWKNGEVYVGDVSFESAAYVARYVVKKVGSDGAKREIFNPETGEIFTREHEYGEMSRNPAIGKRWFEKYATDVFPHDRVITKGVKNPTPRYYDKLLADMNPLYLEEMRSKRRDAGWKRWQEMADREGVFWERYEVHEAVKLAAVKQLKRS